MVEKLVGQDEVSHSSIQLIAGDLDVADGLAFDLLGVNLKRNGHSAVVFRLRQSVERTGFASFSQLEAHLAAGVRVQGAGRFNKALLACHIDDFLSHRNWQADGFRQFCYLVDVHSEHRFQKDVPHHDCWKLHPLQRTRSGRCHDV